MSRKQQPWVLLVSLVLSQKTDTLHQVMNQTMLYCISSYLGYDVKVCCNICLEPFHLSTIMACFTKGCIYNISTLLRCYQCRLCQDCTISRTCKDFYSGITIFVPIIELCHTFRYDDITWNEETVHYCSEGLSQWRCCMHTKRCCMCNEEVCEKCGYECETCNSYVCESCSQDVHTLNTMCEQKDHICALYYHTAKCDECDRYTLDTVHLLDCMHIVCETCVHVCNMSTWYDPYDFTVT